MITEKENNPTPEEQKNKNKTETMRFTYFLETVPLYVEKYVRGFHKLKGPSEDALVGLGSVYIPPRKPVYELTKPSIQLFCPSPLCNGIRWFEAVDCSLEQNDIWGRLSFMYQCRNCKQEQKLYTIIAEKVGDVVAKEVDGVRTLNISSGIAKVQKIGEFWRDPPKLYHCELEGIR